MAEDLDFRSLYRETGAFAERVSALRIARACAPEDALGTLDAALVELERAEGELRRRGNGHHQHDRHGHGEDGDGHRNIRDPDPERQVLRGVFHGLPLAAFLLDQSGVVRRANRMAVELVGTSSTYVTGRPFSALVEFASRAAFDSQLSAVLATGQTSWFDSRLLRGNGSADLRVAVSRVQVPGNERPFLSVVVTTPLSQDTGTGHPVASTSEEEVVVAAARRLEIMSRMTRLLLDEESLSEPVALQRAGRLLAAEFADWAIIDVIRDGRLRRAVVAGHEDRDDGQGVRLLEELDPERASLPRGVLDSANPIVHPVIEDAGALGVTGAGVPVLAPLRAGSLMCVALRDSYEDLGVLTLVRRSEGGRFGLSDLGLIEEIADHLALALRAERRYQRRSDAADSLQASLLPRTLPTISGLEVGVAYHAATRGIEVGGDFYDLFESRNGWGFVLGDVCGKGEDAAAVTGMVRHGIRLLGLSCADPAEVLRQVNHAMVVRQETDRFVTAVAAHLAWRQGRAHVRLVSAGHPHSLLLRSDGSVHFMSGGGLPLGIFDEAATGTEDVDLLPGDTVLLYSDGVTEARGAGGCLYGEERLADALARTRGLPATAMVKAIEDDLYVHSSGRTYDDVALLAVRVAPPA